MTAPFHVVFALFPRITQLDFTGPYEVLTRLPGARCVLASVEGGELEVDSVMRFSGLRRLDSIDECDLLCVPGGFGTVAAVEDQAYLAALRRLGAKARYITSVCTGSLLLAAAGLLRGQARRLPLGVARQARRLRRDAGPGARRARRHHLHGRRRHRGHRHGARGHGGNRRPRPGRNRAARHRIRARRRLSIPAGRSWRASRCTRRASAPRFGSRRARRGHRTGRRRARRRLN